MERQLFLASLLLAVVLLHGVFVIMLKLFSNKQYQSTILVMMPSKPTGSAHPSLLMGGISVAGG
jgi:hypothetical protein